MPLPVRVMTRQELISAPIHDLPGADVGGTMRVVFKGLSAGTFRSTLIVVPTGQRSPARDSEIEHIILVLQGAFDFIVDGERFHLEELDQIFVPVGVRWEYVNAALQESRFLSMVGP